MYCNWCGERLEDSDINCPACGKHSGHLFGTCRNCEGKIYRGVAHCPKCGEPVSRLEHREFISEKEMHLPRVPPGETQESSTPVRVRRVTDPDDEPGPGARTLLDDHRWRLRNSSWLLGLFLCFFNGPLFVFAGIRARDRNLVSWGLLYSILVGVLPWVVGPLLSPRVDSGRFLLIFVLPLAIIWIASIVHGFLVNDRYLKAVAGRIGGEADRFASLTLRIDSKPSMADLLLNREAPEPPSYADDLLGKEPASWAVSAQHLGPRESFSDRLLQKASFEPLVVRRISLYKNKKVVNRSLLAMPLVAISILSTAVFLSGFFLGPSAVVKQFANPGQDNASWILVAYIGIPLLFALAFGCFIMVLVRRGRTLFRRVVNRTTMASPAELQVIMNSIEEVCIGIGIEAPGVGVAYSDLIGADVFLPYRDRPVIVVTSALLGLPLSGPETEALSAHLLAHIVCDDMVKPPSFFSRDYFYLFAGVTAMVAAFSSLVITTGERGYVYGYGLLATAVILSMVVASTYWTSYLYKRFATDVVNGEMLADSIAARLTHNPGALKTLIVRLDLPKAITKPSGMPRRVPVPGKHERGVQSRFLVTISPESLMRQRLLNLESIERGHWPMFEEGLVEPAD